MLQHISENNEMPSESEDTAGLSTALEGVKPQPLADSRRGIAAEITDAQGGCLSNDIVFPKVEHEDEEDEEGTEVENQEGPPPT